MTDGGYLGRTNTRKCFHLPFISLTIISVCYVNANRSNNEGRPVNEALTNCLGREKWLYSHIFSINDISIKGSKHVLWQAMKPAMCYSPHDDEAFALLSIRTGCETFSSSYLAYSTHGYTTSSLVFLCTSNLRWGSWVWSGL